MKASRKSLAALAVLAAVGVGAVAGTTAWFSAKAPTMKNVFVVGSFQPPTTPPAGVDEGSFDAEALTFLFEPGFSPDAALVQPGVAVEKDPYVGIGAGSPTGAYVYLYVKNDYSPYVCFTLNGGWEAVEGETTAGAAAGSYAGGLFRYAAGGALTALEAAAGDAWTATPAFSQVSTDPMADLSGAPAEGEITVYAKIYESNMDAGTVAADAASWAASLR